MGARILIVDDYPVTRLGLRHLLERAGAGHAVGEAGEAGEAVRLLRGGSWDVMILDLTLGGRSGMDLLKQVKQEFPALPVLIVSMHPEQIFGVRALRAGASGYVVKDAAPELLADAVARVLKGHHYISERLTDYMIADMNRGGSKPHELLSDREFQIMRLLAAGTRVSDIARRLSLSVNTISTYRARLMKKLELRHTADITLYAIAHGLIDKPSSE